MLSHVKWLKSYVVHDAHTLKCLTVSGFVQDVVCLSGKLVNYIAASCQHYEYNNLPYTPPLQYKAMSNDHSLLTLCTESTTGSMF